MMTKDPAYDEPITDSEYEAGYSEGWRRAVRELTALMRENYDKTKGKSSKKTEEWVMKEYIKIETLFERDLEGSKKLIEGKWRNETVKFLQNANWIFTEKIDGMNISVVWDGYKVEFFGRTERSKIPSHLVNRLIDLFGGDTNEQIFEQTFGNTPAILYGEGYGEKIQNGRLYREGVNFILFDVYQPDTDVWHKRKRVESIAETFGIDAVPIICVGNLAQGIDFVKTHPKSNFGIADMEGLVGRPEIELKDGSGKRVIVKIKVKDFE